MHLELALLLIVFNILFLYLGPVIKCDLRPIEGYGILRIEHNFNGTPSNQDISSIENKPVSYIGFATDYELLAVISMSTKCEQHIQFNCGGLFNTSYWTSITGDIWKPNLMSSDCGYALPMPLS